MKKSFIFFLLMVIHCNLPGQSDYIPVPSSPQLRWQNYEQIMFVCLDPCTWQGREYDNHSIPLSRINPVNLNTDQWCETARSWGAKLILFVAKHTGGFCWWNTSTTNYGIKDTPWRGGQGDVLKDLSESCRKYGLGLGIYVYPGDETWGAGIGSGGVTKDPSKQAEYNKVFRRQMTEVLSQYGPVQEVWFDGSCKIDVGDILEKYASDAVILQGPKATIRWVGNEDGFAPFSNWYTVKKEDLLTGISTAVQSDPFGDAYAPVEIDVPLLKNKGHKWFWAPGKDSLILSTTQLMDLYYKSVGRGGVLLLNSTPDTTGLIPASHVAAYKAFGTEIVRRFSHPLGSTKGEGKSLEIRFSGPVNVNHAVLQEDISQGQRVLEFEISGLDAEEKWITLYNGTSIGQKRICYFPETRLNALRVSFTNTRARPVILNFAAFNVEGVSFEPENRNEKGRFWSGITGKDREDDDSFKEVTIWKSRRRWTDFSTDLTGFMTDVGQYELDFNATNGQPEFRDWQVELYGAVRPDNVEYTGEGKFRITKSQQTLDEFPAVFRVKIRSKAKGAEGIISIRKLVF